MMLEYESKIIFTFWKMSEKESWREYRIALAQWWIVTLLMMHNKSRLGVDGAWAVLLTWAAVMNLSGSNSVIVTITVPLWMVIGAFVRFRSQNMTSGWGVMIALATVTLVHLREDIKTISSNNHVPLCLAKLSTAHFWIRQDNYCGGESCP